MLKEEEYVRRFVSRHSLKSREDQAIELAAAAVAVSREYRRTMLLAVAFSMLIFTSYAIYRVYEKLVYDKLQERITQLEGKCQNAR